MLLTACLGSEGRHRAALAPPPPTLAGSAYSTGVDANSVMQASLMTPATRDALADAQKSSSFTGGTEIISGSGRTEQYSAGCSISDRFDRKETLAYNFSDNRTRLGLRVSTDGIATVKSAKIQLTYKLQKPPKGTKRCRFDSPVQGLVGSVYNEMFLRQKETIWNDISDRGADFWRH